MALRAQGLLGASAGRESLHAALRRLGAVQLDTISVLARSHELVPQARLGPLPRELIERTYWSGPSDEPAAFEYWAHAACLLPIEHWSLFAFRRRAMYRRGRRWHGVSQRASSEVRARLRDQGPLSVNDLGGAKAGGQWWDWSDVKIAVEWLLDIGEVVCVRRQGWRRVYELAERAVPEHLRTAEPDDKECLVELVRLAGTALGVATTADLADYYRLRREQVETVLPATGLVPVRVEGWQHRGWAAPESLTDTSRGRHRTTLLSPFDSLVWDRPRTRRIFGMDLRLEAYVPRAERVHGYFTMPLLSGGALLGRVDPKREGKTLVAKQLSLERSSAVQPMADALREAAQWVGCDRVRLERVAPARVAAPLQAALDE